MRTVEQWSDECPRNCDPDCEIGPAHCDNLHLPRHKHHTHEGDEA